MSTKDGVIQPMEDVHFLLLHTRLRLYQSLGLAQLCGKWTFGAPEGNRTFQKLSTWTPSKSKTPDNPLSPSPKRPPSPPNGRRHGEPPRCIHFCLKLLLTEDCKIQTPITISDEDAAAPMPKTRAMVIPHPPSAPPPRLWRHLKSNVHDVRFFPFNTVPTHQC